MNDSCPLSNGFTKVLHTNFTTRQETEAISVMVFGILMLVCFMISWRMKNKNMMIVFGASFSFFLFFVLQHTPLVLYSMSYILSSTIHTGPFLDKDVFFPSYTSFEDPSSFRLIQDEIHALIPYRDQMNTVGSAFGDENRSLEVPNRGWKIYYIKNGNDMINQGTCPHISSLVRNNDDIITCFISILEPRSRIPIHDGYYKGIVRYLLGVKIPAAPNVYLCVNEETYKWKEGVGAMFDDLYPHYVVNDSDEIRICLFIDVVRKIENRFLDKINRLFIQQAVSLDIFREESKKQEIPIRITNDNE